MSKILKVNFSQLAERGKNQKELAEKFEKARQDYQTIVNSLNECWEGIDATAFINSCNEYLKQLEKETIYFDTLSEYFLKGSGKYGKVVTDNKNKIDQLNSQLENDVKEYEMTPKGGF